MLFQFTAFDTEASVDVVKVYGGGPTTQRSVLLQQLSGGLSDIPPIYSSNNLMIITFSSDGSVEGAGFSATWMAGNPSCVLMPGSVILM